MGLKSVIQKLVLKPRSLFLIDGLGAILSAFLLGVVLVHFESFFGIPSSVLYFLAALPIVFSLYDWYFYEKKGIDLGFFLKGIAILNLLYACLSLILAFYHLKTITIWGWLYIVLEIMILIILSKIEFSVANKMSQE